MPFARLQTLRPRLACGCATPRPGGTACLSVSHTPPFPICRLTRAPVQTRHLWSAAPGAASYRQHRLVAHVAKPCHEEADTPSEHESGEWDKASVDTEEGVSGAAAAVDWPRLQSIAATTGGIALALVLAITLVGTTEAPLLAYNSLPDVVQDALPSKSQLGISKDTGQINIGAAVQNATVRSLLSRVHS